MVCIYILLIEYDSTFFLSKKRLFLHIIICFLNVYCLPQIIIQSDQWTFEIFSRFIGVDWSLICEDVFTIKSTEDLKSEYKQGSDYYLWQTLSQLEAKKGNLYS